VSEGIAGDNDRSVVLKVKYDQFSALLCADIESEAIESLLASNLDLTATLFKLPHHGAAIAPDLLARLVERVQPKIVIVSVGERNRYGHPDLITLQMLSRHARVLRTDQSGAILVQTDGQGVQLETYGDNNLITL